MPQKGVGASVCLESQDADGKTVKWFWTTGIKGSSDWRKIEGVSRPIPENAVRSYVSVFCSPGSTGKAYFDDVEVAERRMRPVDGLYSSAYRNEAAGGRVDFKAAIRVPDEFAPEDMKAVFSYTTSEGKPHSVTVAPLSRDEASFTCNVTALAVGKSKVSFRLLAPGGVNLGQAVLTFRRLAETYLLAVNSQERRAAAELELSEDFMDVHSEFGPAAQKTASRRLEVELGANVPALFRIK